MLISPPSPFLRGVSYSTFLDENWPQTVSARIVHVFNGAVSFVLPSGELFCAVTKDAGNLPHGVVVDSPDGFNAYGLIVGMTISFKQPYLLFEEIQLVINLSTARPWNPASPGMRKLNWAADNINIVLEILNQSGPPEHLLIMLEMIDEMITGQRIDCGGDLLIERIISSTTQLCRAIRTRNPTEFLETSFDIIGVGFGLTPSGDDLLLGMIAILSQHDNLENGQHWLMKRLQTLVDYVADHTTIVSKTFLQHALNGRFPELLTDFIQAMDNGNTENVEKTTRRLTQFGSSSGREMVFGAIIAQKSIDTV